MAKKKTKESDNSISFEHSFEELQQIVARLEEGQLTLGESLKSYEVGMQRLKECYHALNEAENRIRILNRLDADGNLDMSEFEPEENEGNASADRDRRVKRKRKKSSAEGEELF